MMYQLKRHWVPVVAHFRRVLVLTYAMPAEVLAPLLSRGLVLDEFRGNGFLAVAWVEAEGMRPAFLPSAFGHDFHLVGYRIFCRFKLPNGRVLRGLKILRSDTNRRFMRTAGNLFTSYNYHLAETRVTERDGGMEIGVRSEDGRADLSVRVQLSGGEVSLPSGSPFLDWREARRFAGPLPYTFWYEEETGRMICVEGIREHWEPRPVKVDVGSHTFFEREPFAAGMGRLVSAFCVEDVGYRWRSGDLEPVREKGRAG